MKMPAPPGGRVSEREEVKPMLRRFFAREKGQGLVEYALILFLIAIVVIAVLMLLGPRIAEIFGIVYNSLS